MTVDFNREIRNRIRISVAAYAYEVHNDPVMSDFEFDDLARKIMPIIPTGNAVMDQFFAAHFQPHTGVWVRFHPDTQGLERIYKMLTRNYDEVNNHDLFGPILEEPVARRVEKCKRCGGDIHKFPADGGCYC